MSMRGGRSEWPGAATVGREVMENDPDWDEDGMGEPLEADGFMNPLAAAAKKRPRRCQSRGRGVGRGAGAGRTGGWGRGPAEAGASAGVEGSHGVCREARTSSDWL